MRQIRASQLKPDFYSFRPPARAGAVAGVIDGVRKYGDQALKRYTLKYDKVKLSRIRVSPRQIKASRGHVDHQMVSSIRTVARNVARFARRQLGQLSDFEYQVAPGVYAGQKVIPIERVGVYVPGGRFPLISSLLMGAIPAQVAGVKEIAICSPPSFSGSIHPAILAAADLIGISEIYQVGGIQAIAAMAVGTETISKVDKIVGPGNRFVAGAKKEVYGLVGIDFIAGPSEIMIIADDSADASVVAADLIAQAEHDVEAVPMLVSLSHRTAHRVRQALERQLASLPTQPTAREAIRRNGMMIIVENAGQAIGIANRRAPEHLELLVRNPSRYQSKLTNYGTLFIGPLAAEALGDYSSGLNHILPTSTGARYAGGLSVRDFVKVQTTLRVTRKGLDRIGPVAQRMARLEGLSGHERSISIRMAGTND